MGSPTLTDRARLGLAFSASALAFALNRSPRPFSASFAVTNRCNLRCTYCNFPQLAYDELDIDGVARLFDRLKDLGVARLGLVGGEPLVRKDVAAIVNQASVRRFFISMNSNLMLYAKMPHVFDHVDMIFTSIDGNPDAHRRNRGDHALDGVFEAIADLRRRGKNVIAICVVNEQTVDHASWLLATAERLDIRVHFQPQCVDSPIVRGGLSADLSNQKLRAFWQRLRAEKQAGRQIASSTAYLESLAQWNDFAVSALSLPGERCAAGRGFLFVDPKGNAYPCAYTYGKTVPIDLLRDDWRSAWGRETPCNRCSVGPMLEFNLLFRAPLAGALDAARSYLRG